MTIRCGNHFWPNQSALRWATMRFGAMFIILALCVMGCCSPLARRHSLRAFDGTPILVSPSKS
jgi:hypothetical protein